MIRGEEEERGNHARTRATDSAIAAASSEAAREDATSAPELAMERAAAEAAEAAAAREREMWALRAPT